MIEFASHNGHPATVLLGNADFLIPLDINRVSMGTVVFVAGVNAKVLKLVRNQSLHSDFLTAPTIWFRRYVSNPHSWLATANDANAQQRQNGKPHPNPSLTHQRIQQGRISCRSSSRFMSSRPNMSRSPCRSFMPRSTVRPSLSSRRSAKPAASLQKKKGFDIRMRQVTLSDSPNGVSSLDRGLHALPSW